MKLTDLQLVPKAQQLKLERVPVSVSVSVDEFLPIKAHLNKRGRLIHHYNKYDA
jgi:hypothetical protein